MNYAQTTLKMTLTQCVKIAPLFIFIIVAMLYIPSIMPFQHSRAISKVVSEYALSESKKTRFSLIFST